MQDGDADLDEVDLRIVNAVQYAPRGSWSRLGAAVGVDPVTVARRWTRLAATGRAWATISPGPALFASICIAFVEVDCIAGQARRVAAELAEDAHAVTVELTAGTHDLLLTVAGRDLASVSRYVQDRVAVLAGVTSLRTRVVTRMLSEGGTFRLDTLAPSERAALLSSANGPQQRETAPQIDDQTRTLFRLLAVDGRCSYEDLGASMNVSAATAKRRFERLVTSALFSVRCDFARPLAGWPVSANLWAKVAAKDVASVGQKLIAMPGVRNCAVISGPNNLLLQVWLHSIADAQRFEAEATARCPEIEFADRAITMGHVKLFGRLLDDKGRSTRIVAPDVWADPVS